MALGPNGKVQILFVCTGNICRSPMGEVLLKHKLPREITGDVHVISAGTHAYDGLPASTHAQIVARQFEVDLTEHSSQPLTPYLIAQSDLILAMTPQHVDIIRLLDPTSSLRTFLLKDFGRSKLDKAADSAVEDPIAGDEDVYLRVFRELNEEADRILPYIEKVVKSAK